MSKKICFIGHRRIGFGDIREKLKNAVLNEIKIGCKFFTMGVHGEFDQMALSVCRELRNSYKDIIIEVVITSLHTLSKKYYEDVRTVMYDIEDVYYKRKIIESNYQMIDTCDTIICYVNKNNSYNGSKYAYNYASKKGLKIINLYDEKDTEFYLINKHNL